MHKDTSQLQVMAAIIASGLAHAYAGNTHREIASRSIAIARAICDQLPEDGPVNDDPLILKEEAANESAS